MRVDSEQMGRQPQRTSHSDNSYIKGCISLVNTINKQHFKVILGNLVMVQVHLHMLKWKLANLLNLRQWLQYNIFTLSRNNSQFRQWIDTCRLYEQIETLFFR